MGRSATDLGKRFYMTGQEFNQLLHDQDFLEGEPGGYRPTEKALPYVTQNDYHRGPGGSPQYNRDWTVTTWDESLFDVLDTSVKKQQAAIDAVADRRAAQVAARKAAQEIAERNFRETGSSYISPEDLPAVGNQGEDGNNITASDVAAAGLVIGGILGACYGAYRLVRYAIRKRKEKKRRPE